MSRVRTVRGAAAAGVLVLLAACAQMPSSSGDALSASTIAALVNSAGRSDADKAADARRRPAQTLAFIGVRPGMQALDVIAGGGYTTELLARAIGPSGAVFAQAQPRDPSRPVPPGARAPGSAVQEREVKLRAANAATAPITLVLQRVVDPVPPARASAQLDLVTLMFNYHDLGALGEGRAEMNRKIFQALKPGGLYVIADHSGRAGTGISESNTLHRVEEAFVRAEVEAAGFRLVDSGAFLRNPSDPRDKETPDNGQLKDEFILKFVKP